MLSLDPRDDGGTEPRLLADINVTPFIDVTLVLLVIFMVAAPLMMVGVPLKLPKSEAQALPTPHQPVVVSLDHDGNLYVGHDKVEESGLAAAVATALQGDPEAVVYLRADAGIDYGRVMELLGKLGSGGVARLSLVAEGQSLPGETPP